MVQISSCLLLVALSLNLAPTFAAPSIPDKAHPSRDLGALEARTPPKGISKALGKIAEGVATGTTNAILNN